MASPSNVESDKLLFHEFRNEFCLQEDDTGRLMVALKELRAKNKAYRQLCAMPLRAAFGTIGCLGLLWHYTMLALGHILSWAAKVVDVR